MKTLELKNSILLILICFLFYNGWIEEIVDQNRDFITYERPISRQDIVQKINAPFIKIPELFEELNIEFEKLIKEKKDFDKYLDEIIIITNLKQQKEVIANYKVKYLSINQHLSEFSNVLYSSKNELENSYRAVNNIAEEMKKDYTSKDKLDTINNEFTSIQKDYQIYSEWLLVTIGNTAKLLRDLNLANIKFEIRIEEAPEGLNIPEPEKIKAFTPPPRPGVEATNIKSPEKTPEEKKDIWQEITESDIKENKKKSDELYKSGDTFLKKEKLPEAMNDFKESAKFNKNNYRSIAGISKVYIKKREYDNAIKIINIAIEVFKKTGKIKED